MERIDAFGHILPRKFYEALVDQHPTDELKQLDDKSYFWDIETRLSDMDVHGIDKQVLTLARPPIWQGMKADEILPLVELANNEVHRIAEEHPNRFIPVATLPRLDGEFLDEFDRCIDDMGMSGVQIFSNVDGKPLDSPEFLSFYEKAAAKDVPIWIHPQLHNWVDWMSTFDMKVFGWIFDTSLAMLRLVFSGVLERHPDLKVITHHMGGMVPQYAGRANAMYDVQEMYPNEYEELSKPVPEYFQQFYADTVLMDAHSTDALELGYQFFGPENILFATDYPFGTQEGHYFMRSHVDLVDNIRLSHGDRQKILSGNIRSLL